MLISPLLAYEVSPITTTANQSARQQRLAQPSLHQPSSGELGLVVAFADSPSWIFATLALCRDAAPAQATSFPVLAPLLFASSALVPVATRPSWPPAFARNQRVS